MTDQDGKADRTKLSAQDARQGRIVLNTTSRRALFLSGFIGIVLLAIIVFVFATTNG